MVNRKALSSRAFASEESPDQAPKMPGGQIKNLLLHAHLNVASALSESFRRSQLSYGRKEIGLESALHS
jgi:hypothetical protein